MEIFVREKRIGFTEDWLKWRITRNTRRRERLQKTTHPILLAHANATRALIAAFIHAYTSINALVSIYHTNCSCIRDEAATYSQLQQLTVTEHVIEYRQNINMDVKNVYWRKNLIGEEFQKKLVKRRNNREN